ncbi:MAG: glycosyltransferase family 2 protein [Nitrospirae bacterium]|nr:glycosyltransferase family 2 protein [Nitrospirota bacterium]
MKTHNILLYGAHLLLISFVLYLVQVAAFLFISHELSCSISKLVYLIFAASLFLIFLDFAIFPPSRTKKFLKFNPVKNQKISVGMTAYNDELSIGKAVEDFINRENVNSVVVVDNNSRDRTSEQAKKAGARVVREEIQGYGSCCMRALKEAMKYGDIICLVEGDCTFSGEDLKKLEAYLENADMVVGTRATKELNAPDSQMSVLLEWGNVFMAKLVQLKFWHVRLTDMGCTYRLIRKDALEKIIDKLQVKGNHFLCEMILTALKNNLMVIEISVTFKKRVGKSKGVGGNLFKAAETALSMWRLIISK